MSSLRIGSFHCFEVDDNRKDCKIVVTWEKHHDKTHFPAYTVEHHFKYRNQATDTVSTEEIQWFAGTPAGLRAAIRKAQQVFFGKLAEYKAQYCDPAVVATKNNDQVESKA